MNIRVKKLNDKAKLPYKKYAEDFCYDLVATSEEEVAPNVWKYGVGLAFEISKWFEPLGFFYEFKSIYPSRKGVSLDPKFFNFAIDVRPRSSIWKTGMVLANGPGTVDELYRGEVFIVFYHVMPNMPRYKVGDRICQIKIGITYPIDFIEVKKLDGTERGDKGFGSTGK